ncbi:MAG: hypothetical protein PCFJNLEI_04188 [Verrucomicrobiae bacterium]|nr:hypothetical protein [Verrucomicrobiae bacterium]
MNRNRTNITTLEGVNSYSYNSNNWLVAVTYPDSRTQEFTYDPVGNRVQLADSGKIRSESAGAVCYSPTGTPTPRESIGDSGGLYYYRWRVMDPYVGRFTSEDPLGFADGAILSVYVQNSPLSRLDPSG